MDDFLKMVEEELHHQKILLKKSKQILKKGTEGTLRCRLRKEGTAIYRIKREGGRQQEVNITDQKDLIKELVEKRVYQKILPAAEKNIEILKKLKEQYQPDSFKETIGRLSQSYREAILALGYEKTIDKKTFKPIQYHFDEKRHIHETNCGLMVQSKSEVIITNALTSYGIPFSYEKDFPRYENDPWPMQPDYTFDLPNGEVKLWEHLGMLKREKYCKRNADKLYIYQMQGFHIGRNLIITQDDAKGNCSSPYIDKMIREHLLPYYRR